MSLGATIPIAVGVAFSATVRVENVVVIPAEGTVFSTCKAKR